MLKLQFSGTQKSGDEAERVFDIVQNAKIVADAETYYRAMIASDEQSWNVRDNHMIDTLDKLLKYHGPNSKGIVWAHNTVCAGC